MLLSPSCRFAPVHMNSLSSNTDLSDNSSALGLDFLPPRMDHCDLLLDAIDAQLDQLQVSDFHFLYLLLLCVIKT